MRKAKTIMSLALSVAMVTSMAATAPVMAAESESTDGFNLNLCIASEPQSIDPALNTAMDGSVMCHHMFEGLVKWADDGEEMLLQFQDRLNPGIKRQTMTEQ